MPKMIDLLKDLANNDGGAVESRLRGVHLFKHSKPVVCRPLLYTPGIYIIASGYKIAHLGEKAIRYDADNYLVTSVAMPIECESFPGKEEPLLGLVIDIDMPLLNELITAMNLQAEVANMDDEHTHLGIGPSLMSEDMKDAATKLLKALRSDTETRILAPALVREIYYRALLGSQAPVLYSLAKGSGAFSQVARVISMMQGDYSRKLDVEQMANTANMSISAFHKAFKEVTSDSPIQYLKKIRLAKAKDLIVQQKMKAYLAADEVGYESPSQFSREFKRYFGQSPAEVMREMR